MCCKRHFAEYLMVKWKQRLAVSDRTQHLKQRTSLNYVPYVHCFFTTVAKSDQFYLKHPFTADFAALVPDTSGTLSGSQLRHRKYVSAFSVFSHSSQAQKQATSAAGRRSSGTLLISMALVPVLLFYFLLISPPFSCKSPPLVSFCENKSCYYSVIWWAWKWSLPEYPTRLTHNVFCQHTVMCGAAFAVE